MLYLYIPYMVTWYVYIKTIVYASIYRDVSIHRYVGI